MGKKTLLKVKVKNSVERVFAEERPVVEERRWARAACDLEGNRAGLGCLEHLGNALSFAVVTEWPVGV